MIKRLAHALTLGLIATPLLLAGCGSSSDNNGGTGGNGIIKYDAGSGGTGGTALDGATAPLDTSVVDATIAPDMAPGVDATKVDAPLGVDAPIQVDVATPDLAPVIDTTPAIDLTPVVCTESAATKFSGGSVATNRTLTKACSPYTIKSNLNVNKGATLTIEPGTTLKFDSDTYLYVYAGAIFSAVGTAADPIVLTSSKAAPAAGDWVGFQVQNSANSVTLKYVTVQYAGYGDNAAVDVTNANVDVENCFIHDNAAVGLDATGAIKGAKVLANTFYSNGDLPLIISDGVQADATNTFHSGTLVNTKQVAAFAGNISSTRTFDITEVPYFFASNLNINKAANVTVNAGVTFTFASDTYLYIYAGAIFTAVGTATSPIIFTSSKAVPTQGDWVGLSFQNSSSSITIKYATVQYAGFGSAYAVDATSSTFDIENCTIQHNLSGGLDGTGATHSTLKNNSFSDNNADGTTIMEWTMPAATNTISGNTP
jgi:hypothetical protein